MHVYVSHSRVNSSAALQLCEELRKLGVKTWLDIRDLDPGSDWDLAVISAIETAAAIVFLIGPRDPGDRGQTFEWQQVVDREYYLDPAKPLIPVLIGEPEIPGFLRTRQALVLAHTPTSCAEVAAKVVQSLDNPTLSVDPTKLELGRVARQRALEGFREYSQVLREEDIKRAGLRALE